jgi:alginate O-acetyltransferase complex protein AlgI
VVFHSPNFIIFFIALLIPFFLFKKQRVAVLAMANVIFYAASGLGVLAVFIAVTLVTFLIVHAMRREGWSWLFWLGIAVNAGNLIFFKYTVFLLTSIEQWSGYGLWYTNILAANIALPVGISFYTFQLISYLIDVRRGTTKPTASFLRFWVYISLFPQLVAGPIMRGDELIPQLDEVEKKAIRWNEIKYGVYLFFFGMFKKILFADQIAQAVDPLFAKGEAINAVESWIAAYLFGFQIYFDFSAYSDMAMGLGYILGIKLILNFKSPYISSNPSEFWSRWHISLSRWIRDYIYIGMGGNRKGAVRTQVNLLAAMVISGIWHGAMWTFVLWGAVHGILLILYKISLWPNRWKWIAAIRKSSAYRLLAIGVFFHITTWTWVFFRAESLEQAISMSVKMFGVNWLELFRQPEMIWIGAIYAFHVLEYFIRQYESAANRIWHYVPFPLRSAVYAVLIFMIMYFQRGETYDFIYFQF